MILLFSNQTSHYNYYRPHALLSGIFLCDEPDTAQNTSRERAFISPSPTD
ncbi:hypothetical protein DDI_2585 [Dickeya dianthicola RNS04.9]|nr:hypothetical protein DDI_2585 [Dickeya dianthicola RNS04.9]